MEITHVEVSFCGADTDLRGRLRAFCTIEIDGCFVIRDLKVIQNDGGRHFVAMPSRKRKAHCPQCHCKNVVSAAFCNQCGRKLPQLAMPADNGERQKLYDDVCFPTDSPTRQAMERVVLEAFLLETQKRITTAAS